VEHLGVFLSVLKLQPLPVNPETEKVDSTPPGFESDDKFSSKASLAFVTFFLVSGYQCHNSFFSIPRLMFLMSKPEHLPLVSVFIYYI
jgi:hypothetical protein